MVSEEVVDIFAAAGLKQRCRALLPFGRESSASATGKELVNRQGGLTPKMKYLKNGPELGPSLIHVLKSY